MKRSSAILDSLASFLYTNKLVQTPLVSRIQQLVGDPAQFWSPLCWWRDFMCSIMRELFDTVLFTKTSMQWDLSMCILPVCLVYENGMGEYCNYLCDGCTEEATSEIRDVFQDISKSIDPSLDRSARETFSMRLSNWIRKLTRFAIRRNTV